MIAPHPDDAQNYPIDMCWSHKGMKDRCASKGTHYPRLHWRRKLHLIAFSGREKGMTSNAAAIHANARLPISLIMKKVTYFVRQLDENKTEKWKNIVNSNNLSI